MTDHSNDARIVAWRRVKARTARPREAAIAAASGLATGSCSSGAAARGYWNLWFGPQALVFENAARKRGGIVRLEDRRRTCRWFLIAASRESTHALHVRLVLAGCRLPHGTCEEDVVGELQRAVVRRHAGRGTRRRTSSRRRDRVLTASIAFANGLGDDLERRVLEAVLHPAVVDRASTSSRRCLPHRCRRACCTVTVVLDEQPARPRCSTAPRSRCRVSRSAVHVSVEMMMSTRPVVISVPMRLAVVTHVKSTLLRRAERPRRELARDLDVVAAVLAARVDASRTAACRT